MTIIIIVIFMKKPTKFSSKWDHGAVRWTEHPDGSEGWQATMAGACHEDAGLMPHQEGVRQWSPVWHKAHGSTANSMAGWGKARPVGDRVSTWMGGCSQGPSILENYCWPDYITSTCSIVSRPARERERERERERLLDYKYIIQMCFSILP